MNGFLIILYSDPDADAPVSCFLLLRPQPESDSGKLACAWRAMPALLRLVILLRCHDGLSTEEIARLLRCERKQAEALLSLAFRRLSVTFPAPLRESALSGMLRQEINSRAVSCEETARVRQRLSDLLPGSP